jgi:hypothetical protein
MESLPQIFLQSVPYEAPASIKTLSNELFGDQRENAPKEEAQHSNNPLSAKSNKVRGEAQEVKSAMERTKQVMCIFRTANILNIPFIAKALDHRGEVIIMIHGV